MNRRRARLSVAIAGLALTFTACDRGLGADTARPDPQAFKSYWYQGLAELSRYELQQVRYRDIYQGDAVLIFVTEDFLPDVQVKYEGSGPAEHARSVLKLNFTRTFTTGIYPYSMMSSVFTPVDASPTLKVTTSVQEWCGHTYTQLNLRDDGYRGTLHSYFQDEADRELRLGQVWLEDDVWTRIRLAPDSLPTGKLEIVPGLQYARLNHRPSRAEHASASVETVEDPALAEGPLRVYRVSYRDVPRTLAITFEAGFPHRIVAWQEVDGQGEAARTTRAVRTHSIQLDYWSKNSVDDLRYRELLGLD